MFWGNKLTPPWVIFVLFNLVLWPLVSIFAVIDNPLPAPRTIFVYDYQARQEILRKTYLYPNVPLARLFQNKIQIPVAKFERNLTALLDPGNYFFGFHPRELGYNRNAVKFPFVSLPIFILGFFNLPRLRQRKLITTFLLLSLIFLSLLDSFDIYDTILYLPLISIFFLGVRVAREKFGRYENIFLLIATPLAFIEVFRQIIIFLPK